MKIIFLGAASLGYDATQADLVLKALKGKNVEEVIAAGQKKLASVPSGGAAPAAVPAGNASSAAAPGKLFIFFNIIKCLKEKA